MKRTPWFDAVRVNPVRPGWYEFRTCKGTPYAMYWNRTAWKSNLFSTYGLRALPGDEWRGLAEKP